MNTEQDQPEPLAAVLAEMRRACAHLIVGPRVGIPGLRDILNWADRIEAAVARERNAHTNDIHNALYMATGIPGNADALREVVVETLREARAEIGEDAR